MATLQRALGVTALYLGTVLPVNGSDGLSACADATAMQDWVAQMNALREQGAPCARAGSTRPRLVWNAQLAAAAHAHARDLAALDRLSHVDSQRRSLAERLRAAGYAYATAAENLAAGQDDFKAALDAWANSPSHCANLMKPSFTEVGLACVRHPGSTYRLFWVAEFGSSRRR